MNEIGSTVIFEVQVILYLKYIKALNVIKVLFCRL